MTSALWFSESRVLILSLECRKAWPWLSMNSDFILSGHVEQYSNSRLSCSALRYWSYVINLKIISFLLLSPLAWRNNSIWIYSMWEHLFAGLTPANLNISFDSKIRNKAVIWFTLKYLSWDLLSKNLVNSLWTLLKLAFSKLAYIFSVSVHALKPSSKVAFRTTYWTFFVYSDFASW